MRRRAGPSSDCGVYRLIKEGDHVAIFHSIHRVMQAEKVLKEKQARILLIPVPRQLSADCGLAIRYAAGDRELVEALLAEADLVPAEVYRKEGEDYLPC